MTNGSAWGVHPSEQQDIPGCHDHCFEEVNSIGCKGIYMCVRMVRRMCLPVPFCVHQAVVLVIDKILCLDTNNPNRYLVPNCRIEVWNV